MDEDEETELDYRNSKKLWKRHENNNSEKTLDLEPKAATDQSVSKKNKRKNKATCDAVEVDDGETAKKSPKKNEKHEYKKHAKTPKSSKAQSVKEWTLQKCSPKALPARNSLVEANRKGAWSSIQNTVLIPSRSLSLTMNQSVMVSATSS